MPPGPGTFETSESGQSRIETRAKPIIVSEHSPATPLRRVIFMAFTSLRNLALYYLAAYTHTPEVSIRRRTPPRPTGIFGPSVHHIDHQKGRGYQRRRCYRLVGWPSFRDLFPHLTNCILDLSCSNWTLHIHLLAGTQTLSGARSSEFDSSV